MFLDRGPLFFRSRRSRFFGIVFGDRLGGRLGLDRFLKLAFGLFQLCRALLSRLVGRLLFSRLRARFCRLGSL